MTSSDFIRTIYLGDRSVKAIQIDGWNNLVRVQVDCISRIRSDSGNWEFYTAEDVVDGLLVFTDVDSLRLIPPGPIPNDAIHGLKVQEVPGGNAHDELHCFEISADSVDRGGSHTSVMMEIVARGIHIADPSRPGEILVD